MEKVFNWEDVPPVRTSAGLVKGFQYDGIYTFKGIPYAKAKRFQMPEEPDPWKGVYDATTFGYICPLLSQPIPSHELMAPHRYWPMDENCQNLNIWTRSLSLEAKKPVLVWLHGGGFSAGSAIEIVCYDGDQLSKFGDAVVVTVNHRLNILGYLDLSPFGEKYRRSANAGHVDLVAALKWVKKNIAAFGGDPDNVTIFGHSGGGGKVMCLLQDCEADGLFQKAVIMSGVGDGKSTPPNRGDGREIVGAMLRELEIPEKEVERLETIPYARLAEAYNKVSPEVRSRGFYVGCEPLADSCYKGAPLAVGLTEHAKTVPLMVGSVFSEFSYKIYNKKKLTEDEIRALIAERYGNNTDRAIALFREAYPDKNIVDLLAIDRFVRAPSKELAKVHAEAKLAPTYLYNFVLEFPIEYGKPAWHSVDLAYFFHHAALFEVCGIPGVSDELERKVSTALLQFARTGDPGTEELPWPQVTAEHEYTMVFDRECAARADYDTELIAFNQKVLPKPDLLMMLMEAMENDQRAN